MKSFARRVALLGALALLVPIGTLLATAGSAYAAGPTATFAKTSDWGSGFEGRYTITNGGSAAVTSWTLEFDLPAGTTLGSYWDALISSSGSRYTARNREYNQSQYEFTNIFKGFQG